MLSCRSVFCFEEHDYRLVTKRVSKKSDLETSHSSKDFYNVIDREAGFRRGRTNTACQRGGHDGWKY